MTARSYLRRDVKASNILLSQDCCAKITDMGLSKAEYFSSSTVFPVRGAGPSCFRPYFTAQHPKTIPAISVHCPVMRMSRDCDVSNTPTPAWTVVRHVPSGCRSCKQSLWLAQGTFMYAAPEVLMGQPSNEKVRDGFRTVHGSSLHACILHLRTGDALYLTALS